MTDHVKHCIQCSKEFTPKRNTRIFCSDECRKTNWSYMKNANKSSVKSLKQLSEDDIGKLKKVCPERFK